MPERIAIRIAFSIMIIFIVGACAFAAPAGTGFTYQGRLEISGVPVNGTASLRFNLWDDPGSGSPPAGGNQIGDTQVLTAIPVANGVFSVILNASGEFGPTAFDGNARWLQVTVCKDVDCSDRAILTPRQSISAAPYALAVPGIDGHSLDSVDGSLKNAVYVNEFGRAGIGTTTPRTALDIANGSLTLSGNGGDITFMETADIYARVIDASPVASDPAFRFRTIGSDLLTVLNNGSVGVGTNMPTAALEVHGDVKMGASGESYAVRSNENLRLVRGHVTGNGDVANGTGFTSARLGDGQYTVTFDPPFSESSPTLTVTGLGLGVSPLVAMIAGWGAVSPPQTVYIYLYHLDGSPANGAFIFTAIASQ